MTLPSAPILVGHSMGGFVVQKYLEKHASPSAYLLASVPPTGAWSIFKHLIYDRRLDVLRATATLSLYPVVSNSAKAQELLFPASMRREKAVFYHSLLQDESLMGWLDCLGFDLVDVRRIASPVAVYGAAEDALVRPKEVMGTAAAYRTQPFIFEHVAHDMMLDPRWRSVADAVIAQLDTMFPETMALTSRASPPAAA